MALVEARQYTSEAEMRAAYQARIAMFRPAQKPVVIKTPIEVVPEPVDEVAAFSEPDGEVFSFGKEMLGVGESSEIGWTLNRSPGAYGWRDIVRQVAEKHKMPTAWIFDRGRRHELVLARQEVMFRLSKETPLSLTKIGEALGRDHTTVIHAIRVHQARIDRGEA